jgi:TRAP-type C4-dicarboxylate transport system, small permease component
MRILNKCEDIVIAFGMLISTLLVFVNVALRSFESGVPWSEELIRYLLIFVTFFGSSACIRDNSHFNIDFIPGLFKGRAGRVYQLGIDVVGIIFTVMLAWYGTVFCKFSFSTTQVSPALSIPMYVVYLMIPVAGILMVIRYVHRVAQHITSLRSQHDVQSPESAN